MPYLAFELDALKQVPDCARAARLPEEQLGYGLLRLWSYCWTKERNRVSLTHLAGFFGGDEVRVATALAAFDFVEDDGQAPEPYRVKGADRYLRINEGRSRGGKSSTGNLKRGQRKPEAQPEPTPGLVPAAAGEQPEPTPGLTPALHRAPNTEHRIEEESKSIVEQGSTAPQVQEVFAHWQRTFDHPKARLDAKRTRAIKNRLREGKSVSDLKQAIDGCAVTPHNIGQNDRGQVYDDIELICRDAGHVERFMANATGPPRLRVNPEDLCSICHESTNCFRSASAGDVLICYACNANGREAVS